MDFIKEWVTNIILFILFATMIDMLLPNSKFQKYTKMVIGLLLISIIISPIFKIFSQDFESTIASLQTFNGLEEKNIKNSIDLQKNEIQASQDAYILKQMAVQLKKDAEEELMDKFGLAILDINILVDDKIQRPFPDNLQKVVIQLHKPNIETKTVEVVKSVEINTNKPLVEAKEPTSNEKITSLLSKKWKIDEDMIDLYIERGDKAAE